MAQSTAQQIIASLRNVDKSNIGTEADRLLLRQALTSASNRLAKPWDIALDHNWVTHAMTGVVRTLIKTGILEKWVAAGGKPASLQELASMGDVDPALLKRLLNMLVVHQYLIQPELDTYAPTDYSIALGDPKFADLYTFGALFNNPVFNNFPKFAAETNYQNPVDSSKGNLQSWTGQQTSIFDLFAARPDIGSSFNNAMTLYSAARVPWTKMYPSDSIVSAAKPDRALVVDIGGSVGHDLEKFRALHPDVPYGSLILQDLPDVVEKAKLTSPCVAQPYDFFDAQPVKGARVYYMHTVLHDWDDEKATAILKNIASAMEPKYSRVLIHDIVIKDLNPHVRAVTSDIAMMMSNAALERSDSQWQAIIDKVGLKIIKTWTSPEASDAIIEVELV